MAILIGSDDAGRPICGPCAGSDRDYRCRGCAQAIGLVHRGHCHRCTLDQRVTQLLTGPDGRIPSQLQRLRQALLDADQPASVLRWLHGPAAALLAQLVATNQPINHQLLDQLPPGQSLHWLRQLLIHTGALPNRDEHLERIPAWLDHVLANHPPDHANLIGPFAHWAILRRARRRQPSHGSTSGGAGFARARILIALQFLTWLDSTGLTLATVTQQHLDTWLNSGSTNRYNLRHFLTWTRQRGLTPALAVPHRPDGDPATFLDDDEHWQQLRRCLTDTTLPTDVRFAGALLLLFGTRLSRIVQLRTDHITHHHAEVYLHLHSKPVLLPPPLAALTNHLTSSRRHLSPVERGSPTRSSYLLPGLKAGRHRDEHGLGKKIRNHGITTHAGRNTALLALATDLPAAILADLVGLNPNTTTQWARRAQRNWTDYLHERPTSIPNDE